MRTASRKATIDSSRASDESSRRCNSTPSATGTRRQLTMGSASWRTAWWTPAMRTVASDCATRRSRASPVTSRMSLRMVSSDIPSRWRILMASSCKKWR
ncbi:MAG: hypothetical protein IPN16_16240 [Gemmatimonadetes bacterium]|nr:hypothetical protein [Gemmatimonadota bacterium]